MAKRIFFTLLAFSCFYLAGAQNDPVLFTVEDTPVKKSEFEYIYSKTNGEKADFSQESLDEYLDLYVKFKLKVQKAKEMKLDTIKSLQQELDGYRRQLADSYLIDREVTEKLVKEVYERTKQDVNLSHVLITIPANAKDEDIATAKAKADEVKALLDKGEPFERVARKYSQDKSAARNGGDIGWVTALFPNGFYDLETASYESEIGKVVGPIRTSAGYHVVKVNERRKARGQIEVAHILVRAGKPDSDTIKDRKKIDEVLAKLNEGGDWDDLANEYSDDKVSSRKGGYLGFFGINKYEKVFEDAAFALENDGDYTRPIETKIGWHIIKRISKKDDLTYQQAKSRLQTDVKKDKRFDLAKAAMVKRILATSDFKENRTTLDNFISSLEQDSAKTFLTYKWKAPKELPKDELFSFGGGALKINLGDFQGYAQRASRKRQQGRTKGVKTVVEELYQDYITDNALAFEEQQLDKKYPEFKSLMREYEEGVLLFEVTKMEVWDKASSDTVGLKKFYEENKEKYQWGERARLSQYSLVASEKMKINQIREFSKTNTSEDVLKGFNPPENNRILTVRTKTFERGRNDLLDKMNWKVGELSPVDISSRDKSLNFFKIEEILPPSQKSLKEARGYVVADYQDFLEKAWLKGLEEDYKVKVEDKVFKKMVKK